MRVEFLNRGENRAREEEVNATIFPAFELLGPDGGYTGVQFHGIPGGHEINSFILALYNAAGPGQAIGEDTLQRIEAVKTKVNLKVGVSLSWPCLFRRKKAPVFGRFFPAFRCLYSIPRPLD